MAIDLKAWLAEKNKVTAEANKYLEYVQELLAMPYEDACIKIRNRNGKVGGSYFLDESCKSENKKIKKGKEGLEIHHIREWTESNPRICALSDKVTAAYYPFEYQLPENLVYADKLEHLLLHVKINILRMYALNQLIDDSVDKYMIPTLNKLFDGQVVSATAQIAFERIKNFKDAYFAILDYYDQAKEDFINKK